MKTVKTASFAALAAILVLSGCGSSSSSNENESTDVNGKVTLNFLTQSSPLAPADPNDKLINKRLEEKRASIYVGRTLRVTSLLKKKFGYC